jgi:AraC family transcriptional regulator, transcriptional activator of pobA
MMKFEFREDSTGGVLYMHRLEKGFERFFFRDRKEKLLTIAWNTGAEQQVVIDDIPYRIPARHLLPLMVNDSFTFEKPENIIAWQFNKPFYCIVNHDKEVSCVGFLFYGAKDILFLKTDKKEQQSLTLLLKVFEEEFGNRDAIQAEMLRVLLKRLIIKCTRLAKDQYLDKRILETEMDIVRHFNLAVENHYRKHHDVAYYAGLLNRSPKTLSNYFALYNQKSPLQIIHERVALEARRMLLYTDDSVKQISYHLGFEELTAFSRFFKKQVGVSPLDFKENHRQQLAGKK